MAQSDKVVRKIRVAAKKPFTSEDKIRIVLEGLRGQIPISELCRREGLSAATITNGRKTSSTRAKMALPSRHGEMPPLMKSAFSKRRMKASRRRWPI